MGMGYGGAHAEVVKPEDVAKLAPLASKKLTEFLGDHGISMDAFFMYQSQFCEEFMDCMSMTGGEEAACKIEAEDFDAIVKEMTAIYLELQQEFEIATTVRGYGLTLDPAYHNHDDCGDRYDDDLVCGGFWCVDGVYRRTSAGEKFRSMIHHCLWVTHG